MKYVSEKSEFISLRMTILKRKVLAALLAVVSLLGSVAAMAGESPSPAAVTDKNASVTAPTSAEDKSKAAPVPAAKKPMTGATRSIRSTQ